VRSPTSTPTSNPRPDRSSRHVARRAQDGDVPDPVRADDRDRDADRGAIALDRADFDADLGTLIIRRGKFGKSRELPLHPTTTSALTRYLARWDRPRPVGPTEALLVSTAGTRLWMSDVQTAFRTLRARAGILPHSAACRPRLHDLRHSFAVRTLLDAYRADGDPGARIAALSTYLGHVDPGKT
jgi:integrase/recombinase XerD